MRGDLSQWLIEIDPGVYAGHLSARVRDALWSRVRLHLKHGRATLVYTTQGEQGLTFRTHGATWQPIDLEGITLIRRPLPAAPAEPPATPHLRPGFSKAAHARMTPRPRPQPYAILDLETTGLDPERDAIIECAAIRVTPGAPDQTFATLILPNPPPTTLTHPTITPGDLLQHGQPPDQALRRLLAFIDNLPLIGYNIAFDLAFLHAACRRHRLPPPTNPTTDLLPLARRKLRTLTNHRLATLAAHFHLPTQTHRALDDARLTLALLRKLI